MGRALVAPAFTWPLALFVGFPGAAVVKKLPTSAGNTSDVGLIPGLGRSPGVGNGNPLQDSYLGNSTFLGIRQNDTQNERLQTALQGVSRIHVSSITLQKQK